MSEQIAEIAAEAMALLGESIIENRRLRAENRALHEAVRAATEALTLMSATVEALGHTPAHGWSTIGAGATITDAHETHQDAPGDENRTDPL